MDYRDRHVVVTGGTGALGTAVVGGLIEAGAVCHVPYINSAEVDRFAWRNHSNVKLVGKTTKSDLIQQIDMNFVTAFLCCRTSISAMRRTGAGGRIVNVASRPALD